MEVIEIRIRPACAVGTARPGSVLMHEEGSMSWVYWGIVAGLGMLVTLFFLCVEILRPTWKTTERDAPGSGASGSRRTRSSGSRHAA